MQSNEYKIERWDVIYDDKLNLKRPLIYIVPDQTLIEFASLNKDSLYATIKGSGNDCYDNVKAKVSLVSIKETRPNLFDKTGYHTLQFNNSIWVGYPNSLGSVSFEGLNKQAEPQPTPTPSEQPTPTSNPTLQSIENFMVLDKKPNKVIIILAILLILVLLVRFLPGLFN